ncbi:MAG: TetR/AcrR family transcriptional regulator, partial [Bacteroidota bacterium]
VSVGNLAYHYSNKESIVFALYNDLTQQQKQLLAEYKVVPLFDNIDLLIRHTYQLQQQYIFFYLDTLEIVRAYPKIGEAHRQHISMQIAQLKSIIYFNVSRGALIDEPMEGLFEKLATQIWMTTDFWLAKHKIRIDETTDESAYREAIWSLFIPYFSVMGKLEYRQMLQMNFLNE